MGKVLEDLKFCWTDLLIFSRIPQFPCIPLGFIPQNIRFSMYFFLKIVENERFSKNFENMLEDL